MTDIEALQNLGLNEKEAKVYLALIGLDTATAYSIAEKSGLKRSTTYFIVDELIKKGIVATIPRTKKQMFKAISPEELIVNAENRLHKTKDRLPQLSALTKKSTKKPSVYFYEGEDGLEQTLQYGVEQMAGKELIGFYATATNKTLKTFNHFTDFNNNLKNHRITIRGIVPDDPKQLTSFRKTDKEYKRMIKEVPLSEYGTTVSVEIGDNFVKIQDWDNLQSIIIENNLITKTLKEIFEMIWKRL